MGKLLSDFSKGKVKMYCRVSCEIDNKNKNKLNQMTNELQKKFKNIDNYNSYSGFHDLRDYKLSEQEFKDLWITQDFLYYCESNKEIIKNSMPELFESLKELSADYQQELFKHEKIDKKIELEEPEIEK